MATRKNVSKLSPAERSSFVAALKGLKAAPSKFNPATAGRYDDYVYVHMQAMLELRINDRAKPVSNGNWTLVSGMRMPMWAHRCPAFLPWHRELLYQFERDLQAVSGDSQLGIPYWDWSVDQSPNGAPWLPDLLGGDGGDGPVTSGPFAGAGNWKLTLSEDSVDHLVRGFGRMKGFPRLPTVAEVNATLAESTYDKAPWNDSKHLVSFRNQVEGWYVPPGSSVDDGMHNLVHLWVGGNNGTILPSTSPNDPAFFLHHCNIDRLWAVWQLQNPIASHYLPVNSIPGEPGQALNEPMIFFDTSLSSSPPWADPPATPAKVMDHHGLGYIYDFESAPPHPPAMELVTPVRRSITMHPRDRFRVRIEDIP